MEAVPLVQRPNLTAELEGIGFTWHTMYDAPYWDESHAFRFSLDEIEGELEAPTAELMELCYAAVDRAVVHPELLTRLRIPEAFHGYVVDSWRSREREVYGRFDFSYNGSGPAKLLEFNADTPTGLFESAVVQWVWLEDRREAGILPFAADQFNSVQEKLISAFRGLGLPGTLHLGGVLEADEDAGTIGYLADCAAQAGLTVSTIDMQLIGVTADGRFTDMQDTVISTLFKLYPWEVIFAEEFARHIPRSGCRFIEPAWKSILSNKAILPLLWEMNPGHPNLLPAFFADDPRAAKLHRYAEKPIFSREGANITLSSGGNVVRGKDEGYGEEGFIRQELHPLPSFGGSYAVIGSWVVAGQPAGICVREDDSPITQNLSRFIPHFIA